VPFLVTPLDFALIGAQKCATTWFYDCLSEHPQLQLPADKREIAYFGGPLFRERGESWFEQRYAGAKGERLRGDISVEYLNDRGSAALLRREFPHVKVVAVMRDPVERAISAYFWYYRKGLVHDDLDTALARELRDVRGGAPAADGATDFLRRSLYRPTLEPWLEAFPPQQVMTVLFEDVSADPASALRSLFTFLGVDPSFTPRAIGSRPKRNAYSLALLGLERLAPVDRNRGRVLKKLMDLANQLLATTRFRRQRPALAPELAGSLRELFDAELVQLDRLVRRLPEANRPGWAEVRSRWRQA